VRLTREKRKEEEKGKRREKKKGNRRKGKGTSARACVSDAAAGGRGTGDGEALGGERARCNDISII